MEAVTPLRVQGHRAAQLFGQGLGIGPGGDEYFAAKHLIRGHLIRGRLVRGHLVEGHLMISAQRRHPLPLRLKAGHLGRL